MYVVETTTEAGDGSSNDGDGDDHHRRNSRRFGVAKAAETNGASAATTAAAAAGLSPAGDGKLNSDDPPPTMPYTQAPPPGWLEALKTNRRVPLRAAQRQHQRPRRRLLQQRLVLEFRLSPNSPGGEIRFSFAPREGQTYHLWCEVRGSGGRVGPGRAVSVIFDDGEQSVRRNYRSLLESGVIRAPLPCHWGNRAETDALRPRPIPDLYTDLLLAACRQLRPLRQQTIGGDREVPLASLFARHGIPTTELSMISVEELVRENLRLGVEEAEEHQLLLEWERDRAVQSEMRGGPLVEALRQVEETAAGLVRGFGARAAAQGGEADMDAGNDRSPNRRRRRV